MITGFVVALPEEVRTLTKQKITKGQCCFITDRAVIVRSGAGPENAQAAARLLLAKGATQLISWGCAAALSPHLQAGDLTLATSLMDAEARRDAGFSVSSDWHNYAQNLLTDLGTVHTGTLLESKTIVADSHEKNRFYAKTAAIALDMESIAVARIAKENQVPFLAIRAIADPVNMTLPAAITVALNEQGDIVLSKLLMHLLLHPAELPGLIRLGRHFALAQETLKKVAGALDKLTAFERGY